jgi:predicted dehydrogenase
LAIVGIGAMGAKHAALVQADLACRLVGIRDLQPARHAAAQALGVPLFDTTTELLDRTRPDGAIIATSAAAHAASALDCLDQAVPVLVATPVAATLAQARRIAAALQTAGCLASTIVPGRRQLCLPVRYRALKGPHP